MWFSLLSGLEKPVVFLAAYPADHLPVCVSMPYAGTTHKPPPLASRQQSRESHFWNISSASFT